MDGGNGAEVIGRSSSWTIAGALILLLAIGFVFLRVAGFEFLIYGDDEYLTDNAIMQQGLTLDSIAWALSSFHAGSYQPVTWLTEIAQQYPQLQAYTDRVQADVGVYGRPVD